MCEEINGKLNAAAISGNVGKFKKANTKRTKENQRTKMKYFKRLEEKTRRNKIRNNNDGSDKNIEEQQI